MTNTYPTPPHPDIEEKSSPTAWNPSTARMPDDERRRTPRFELDARVTLESDTNFYTGFAENISDGGLFIATWSHHPIGTRLALVLELPDGGPALNVHVIVRWLREGATSEGLAPGMGCQFDDLSQGEQDRIEALLTSREPLFHID